MKKLLKVAQFAQVVFLGAAAVLSVVALVRDDDELSKHVRDLMDKDEDEDED